MAQHCFCEGKPWGKLWKFDLQKPWKDDWPRRPLGARVFSSMIFWNYPVLGAFKTGGSLEYFGCVFFWFAWFFTGGTTTIRENISLEHFPSIFSELHIQEIARCFTKCTNLKCHLFWAHRGFFMAFFPHTFDAQPEAISCTGQRSCIYGPTTRKTRELQVAFLLIFFCSDTVDGQNPAPPRMMIIPLLIGF